MAEEASGDSSPVHVSDDADENREFDARDGLYRCSDCDVAHTERYFFNQHLLGNHPLATVCHLCPYCGLELPDIEMMHKHAAKYHRDERMYMACVFCHRRYEEGDSMEFHYDRHQEFRQRRTCRVCNRLFSTKRQLRAHLIAGHTTWDREYECSVCGDRYIKTYSKFRQEHDGKTRRYLPMCERCKNIVDNMLQTDEYAQPDGARPSCSRERTCSRCGQRVYNQENHGILGQARSQGQIVLCRSCTETCSRQDNRRDDEETRPRVLYVCEKCNKTFNSLVALTRHKKNCPPAPEPPHEPDYIQISS